MVVPANYKNILSENPFKPQSGKFLFGIN